MEWLEQQPDLLTESQKEETSSLTLHEAINVNHLEIVRGSSSLYTKFSMSELSGAIGIASTEAKPSLSVMYPRTDKPPLILHK